MPPRSIWSGTISFGIVSVPVRTYAATSSKELKFHVVTKEELQPVGYDKVRKDTGEHVDRLDIELTHSIGICDFVDLDEIDPIFYRQGYFLAPQDGAEKPRARDDVPLRQQLLDLLEAKAEGEELPEPEAAAEGEVVDLMAALRESVARARKRPRARTA